jgi:hypothetical protein
MSRMSAIHAATPGTPMADDPLMRTVIADELERIRELLEKMGMGLCADPQIITGHMDALQTIDELCQRNENLSRTLRAADMVAEAGNITLESLRVRIGDALTGLSD